MQCEHCALVNHIFERNYLYRHAKLIKNMIQKTQPLKAYRLKVDNNMINRTKWHTAYILNEERTGTRSNNVGYAYLLYHVYESTVYIGVRV